MPAPKPRSPRRAGRSGGGCTVTTIFKLVWLAAAALFLVSISVTVKINTDDDSSTIHHQKFRRKRPNHHHRRNQKRKTEAKNADLNGIIDPGSSSHNNTISSISPSENNAILLQWLRQQRNNSTSTSTQSSLPELLSTPLYYTPGTLPLTQLSTLKQCYTDPKIYRNHFKETKTRRIPYSKKHQLAYIMLPKSGSSTARFMMQHEFDAKEVVTKIQPPLNVITFVRDPLSRFFSSYEESYVRTAPWQSSRENPYYPERNNGKFTHPFPWLYENLNNYHAYEDVFCPPHTRNNRRECIDRQSQENGTLASRLERFVHEYDGRSPFDIHLTLQVPILSSINDGRAIHITELYNTTNSEGDWNAIAKRYLGEEAVLQNAKMKKGAGTKESGGVIQGRSYPRRLDKSLVGEGAQRRICELALLDYCCLNFPLPSVCSSGDDAKLSCKMDYDDMSGRIRIQPGIFPDRGE